MRTQLYILLFNHQKLTFEILLIKKILRTTECYLIHQECASGGATSRTVPELNSEPLQWQPLFTHTHTHSMLLKIGETKSTIYIYVWMHACLLSILHTTSRGRRRARLGFPEVGPVWWMDWTMDWTKNSSPRCEISPWSLGLFRCGIILMPRLRHSFYWKEVQTRLIVNQLVCN